MVGAGSLIESSKASSQNYLLQGFALAVALHLVLLAAQLRFTEFSKEGPASLNVSIQFEEIDFDKKSSAASQPIPLEKRVLDSQIIVAEQRANDPQPRLTPRFQISTSSESIKRFLQSETDHNIKPEKNKLSEFSATFAPYFEAAETVPETSYRDFQSVLGGGQYKVFKNGKVTCLLNMVPLSFDDHVYGAGGGAKDCTPKKKFDLNLRKNTRD